MLKAYQMIFTIISVTPIAIQFATSLSYDCYNYVALAWLSATLINLVDKSYVPTLSQVQG